MKLYIVGTGPGNPADMTPRAAAALSESTVIAGYTGYVAPLKARYPEKTFLETGMRGETERCHAALKRACGEDTVSMVCSGDAGVYGMAGLLFELAQQYPPIEIEVVPGVTAAISGAALLGAPLGHDFAVISLSDLLTPWETIERRLALAAEADFVLCLYNPASHRRTDALRRACDILLRHRTAGTACGITQNIGREGQTTRLLTLDELRETSADMFTTVFVGSSSTVFIGSRLVTPRGYRAKGPC